MMRIFLVDDDAVFLNLLKIEFLSHPLLHIEIFATGELCLQSLSKNPDIIILDYYLDGIEKHAINGIQTLDKILEYCKSTPVVMLSSQDSIDIAVECMHHGAFDYVVKSETAYLRLQNIITNISRSRKMEKELSWYADRM